MSNDYRWFTELTDQFMRPDYLADGDTLDDRVGVICDTAEKILGIDGFAEKFKANIKKGWYSLSTPVWANYGTNRGLPISCFGSHISDSMESILYTHAEIGMMSKYGGGTSAYLGNLRGRGSAIKDNGESSGAVHFAQLFDKLIGIISQGNVRRGNVAVYLPVDHPDIHEFLTIRSEGSPIQDISFGVCVPDEWMHDMIRGDYEKRVIWARVIECRYNTGYPYIFFTDNANSGAPDVYKDSHKYITHSNLCSEVMLPDTYDESFVCCLSSMNVLHFDEWKDTDAVELMVYFLDSVISEFVDRAEKLPFMDRAVKFAENHRALGLGQLGWHSYLQSKLIPFESMEAKLLNTRIAKTIRGQAYAASEKLAKLLGMPEQLRPYGRRNSTLLAIAPTKSSAFILGQVSEGIEPNRSNFYIKDLAKGKFTVKNPYLVDVLSDYGKNDDETWTSILHNGGSVQHLTFLTDREREVFKTFAQISPREIVIQAAQRQKFIDQGQSLNLMIHPSVSPRDVNSLLIEAWQLGVKSFYYQISVNAAQSFAREILSCSSCEA